MKNSRLGPVRIRAVMGGAILLVFLATAPGYCGEGNASNVPATATASADVKVLRPSEAEMRSEVLIGVYGKFAEEIAAAQKANPETVEKNLVLYLNGVAIVNGKPPAIIRPEAPVASENAAGEATAPAPIYNLRYELERDSNEEANRKAWDDFLTHLGWGWRDVQVGVALNGTVHLCSPGEFKFRASSVTLIAFVAGGGIVLFLFTLRWLVRTTALRNAGAGTPYSLGKTQMAIWGLLASLCFFGVWIVGRHMERIPEQVLILMGISGATGLGSVMMNGKKQAAIAAGTAVANPGAQETQNWWPDIISDENGPSFHRFQVVLWTGILCIIFVYNVVTAFSMPEFSDTLLILMGISNGTYLGFKQNEA